MTNEMTLTYQTRLLLNEGQEKILHEYASLLSTVERSLYAETAKGKSSASCKNIFLNTYGITARQFNACRVSLEGKISACKAGQELAITNLKQQITLLDKKIQNLEKKPSKHFALHQKNRRKTHLSSRLTSMEEDRKQGRIRLCFGGKSCSELSFISKKAVLQPIKNGKSNGKKSALVNFLYWDLKTKHQAIRHAQPIQKMKNSV